LATKKVLAFKELAFHGILYIFMSFICFIFFEYPH